jgi:hypothetical protein
LQQPRNIRPGCRADEVSTRMTVPVVTVLTIGIGATTAVFTLANGVLIRPLPGAAPERLVLLDESAPERDIPSMGTTLPNLRDYQRETRTLQGRRDALTRSHRRPDRSQS